MKFECASVMWNLICLLLPLVTSTPAPTHSPTMYYEGVVSAVVGSTSGLAGATNGVGTVAKFNIPWKPVISQDDIFAYVADYSNERIRKIALSTNSVTTFIGTTQGYLNGVGTTARFHGVRGLALASDDSFMLVSDYENNRIRYVNMTSKHVGTLVGSSLGNANGIGTSATFNGPRAIALSSDNSFALSSDYTNAVIRCIVVSTRVVTTIAGKTLGSASDGIGTNARFNNQCGLSISPHNTYALIAERDAFRIRKLVISTGAVSTLVGSSSGSADGVGSNGKFANPFDISIAPDGLFALVSDYTLNVVKWVDLQTLKVKTIAGSVGNAGNINGVGTNALLNSPVGISISPSGEFAVCAEYNGNRVRKISNLRPRPTANPTTSPTVSPSSAPSVAPTAFPSSRPSCVPTAVPTGKPTTTPTSVPTVSPTYSHSPTKAPTLIPTPTPTRSPTLSPTLSPMFPPTTTIRIDNLQQPDKFLNIAEIKIYYQNTQVFPTSYSLSSTEPGYPVSQGFDGNLGTFFHSLGSTAARDWDPYLEIEMNTPFDTLHIWNRNDMAGMSTRIVGARIRVLAGGVALWESTFNADDWFYQFGINSKSRIVRIDTILASDHYLNLGEVRFYRGRTQVYPITYRISSVLSGYPLSQCFDNNINTFCHSNSGDLNPWLEIFMGEVYFDTVIVWNRQDNSMIRIVGSSIRVRTNGVDTFTYTFVGERLVYWFDIESKYAVFRMDASTHSDGYFNLVEAKFYDGRTEVVPLCYRLSSTYPNYPVENCFDKDLGTSCVTATGDASPFLEAFMSDTSFSTVIVWGVSNGYNARIVTGTVIIRVGGAVTFSTTVVGDHPSYVFDIASNGAVFRIDASIHADFYFTMAEMKLYNGRTQVYPLHHRLSSIYVNNYPSAKCFDGSLTSLCISATGDTSAFLEVFMGVVAFDTVIIWGDPVGSLRLATGAVTLKKGGALVWSGTVLGNNPSYVFDLTNQGKTVRVDCQVYSGDDYFNIQEFRFYDGRSRVLPLHYRVSSTYTGLSASYAFDDDETTYYVSSSTDTNPWIEVYMGNVSFNYIVILTMAQPVYSIRMVGSTLRIQTGIIDTWTSTFVGNYDSYLFDVYNKGTVVSIDSLTYSAALSLSVEEIKFYKESAQITPLFYRLSSTAAGTKVGNAFDNSLSTSCSTDIGDSSPALEVYLGEVNLDTILVWTMADPTYSISMVGATVRLKMQGSQIWTAKFVGTKELHMFNVESRGVLLRIDSTANTDKYLNLADIKMYNGHSLVQPLYYRASSVTARFPISNVFDGNLSTFFQSGGTDTSAWMEVYMGGVLFDTILVWNRKDNYTSHIVGATIRIKVEGVDNWSSSFAVNRDLYQFDISDRSRIIRIDSVTASEHMLNLAEIKIYNFQIQIYPLFYRMSSTESVGYDADKTFDGNLETFCHSDVNGVRDYDPWLEIYMGNQEFDRIVVYNRIGVEWRIVGASIRSQLNYVDYWKGSFPDNRSVFVFQNVSATPEPTSQPTSQPSVIPTSFPTSAPSSCPSGLPSAIPSSYPSLCPTSDPSRIPSSSPSSRPSNVPSSEPSTIPSSEPTGMPSDHPSSDPSSSPSTNPSGTPSVLPSTVPSATPTGVPSSMPSSEPTRNPSGSPTTLPSRCPSTLPTSHPTTTPSSQPTNDPTNLPSSHPTNDPTSLPSGAPTIIPSSQPTNDPTSLPSCAPTTTPSSQPTNVPTSLPSGAPTIIPSSQPTNGPTSLPSSCPSCYPTSYPLAAPSSEPSSLPSGCPSYLPTAIPSNAPTVLPSTVPTSQPTTVPSALPSARPTLLPSGLPSSIPSASPSSFPSGVPTVESLYHALHAYGTSKSEYVNAIALADDWGTLIAGHMIGNSASDYDGFIMKTDSCGNVKWAVLMGDSMPDSVGAMVTADDNTVLIVGESINPGTKVFNLVFGRLEQSSGQVLTMIAFSLSSATALRCSALALIPSGNVLLAGTTTSPATSSGVLLLLDHQHRLLWSRSFQIEANVGQTSGTEYSAVSTLRSGSSVAVGGCNLGTARYGMVTLMDSVGEYVSSFKVGAEGSIFLQAVTGTRDGGYVLAAELQSVSGLISILVVKVSPRNTLQWSTLIDGGKSDVPRRIIVTHRGEIVLVATSTRVLSGSSVTKGIVVLLSREGNMKWVKIYANLLLARDSVWDVFELPGGGLRIAGNGYSYRASASSDAFMLQTGAQGYVNDHPSLVDGTAAYLSRKFVNVTWEILKLQVVDADVVSHDASKQILARTIPVAHQTIFESRVCNASVVDFSRWPTEIPSTRPSWSPPSETPLTTHPSCIPSTSPITHFASGAPSSSTPTLIPSTSTPTACPSIPSAVPSSRPTYLPDHPTPVPSPRPSFAPSNSPSLKPSLRPSFSPSVRPTACPAAKITSTSKPSHQRTSAPTIAPSTSPTCHPSIAPSASPTCIPSATPTLISSQPSAVNPVAGQITQTPSTVDSYRQRESSADKLLASRFIVVIVAAIMCLFVIVHIIQRVYFKDSDVWSMCTLDNAQDNFPGHMLLPNGGSDTVILVPVVADQKNTGQRKIHAVAALPISSNLPMMPSPRIQPVNDIEAQSVQYKLYSESSASIPGNESIADSPSMNYSDWILSSDDDSASDASGESEEREVNTVIASSSGDDYFRNYEFDSDSESDTVINNVTSASRSADASNNDSESCDEEGVQILGDLSWQSFVTSMTRAGFECDDDSTDSREYKTPIM